MNTKAALAARNREVRVAAGAWRRAGIIDDGKLATIEAAYPDDRGRLGPVFRTLIGGFAAFGVLVALGLASLVLQIRNEIVFGGLCLVFGLGLLAVTELQIGPFRRAQAGAETATGLLAVLFLTTGFAFLISEMDFSTGVKVTLVLAWAGLLSTFAALRWGSVSGAMLAAVFFFLLLAQPPNGRFFWIAAGAALPVLLLRGSDSARLPPPHREGLTGAAVVALLALYLGLHLGSWDEGLLGYLSAWNWSHEWAPDHRPDLRGFAILATALLPVLVVAAGLWSRRRPVLLAGVAMGIASLATLRAYVHLLPLSTALILVGALAILAVVLLRRWLDRSPGHERFGFTAEPLFDDPRRMLLVETAAGMISLTPAAAQPQETPAGFDGSGGRSGGGGATESF